MLLVRLALCLALIAAAPARGALPAPTPPPTPSSPAPQVTARGQVLEASTRRPVVNARVRVQGFDLRAYTDKYGRFTLPPLAPRAYILLIDAPGFDDQAVLAQLRPNAPLPPILLKPNGTRRLQQLATIEVQETLEKPPEPVERVLTLKEVQYVPGTFNDLVRVVQNLPGVARTPVGVLVVRGTEPQDTGYYIDGIRIPQIFHFFGLHTVVSSDILDELSFLPGNYGVRYGRSYGGVVDVNTTDSVPLNVSGYLGMDLINTSAFLRVPIRPDEGLLLSFRRSYVDLLLSRALEFVQDHTTRDINFGFIQAPRYWDYQALYNHKLNENNALHVMVFGSSDAISLAAQPPGKVRKELTGDGTVSTDTSFHKILARWTHTAPSAINRLTFSIGPDSNGFGFGTLGVEATNLSLFLRDDLNLEFPAFPPLRLRAGVDAFVGFYNISLKFPFTPGLLSLDPLAELEPYSREIKGYYFAPAAYVEADYNLTSSLRFTPGLRIDPLIFPGQYSTVWVDPRLSVSYRVASSSVLKAAAGRYGQPPPPFAVDEELGGQPDLKAPYALQYALGGETSLPRYPQLSLELTGFYSDLRGLVLIDGMGSTTDRPSFNNDGRGRNMGLELLLRHSPHKGLFGWLSYTLQKTERVDGEPATAVSCLAQDQPQLPCWYPFDFDQTHILTLVGSYELPKAWTLGLRFRYATGTPYTSIQTAYQDLDQDSFQAIPRLDGVKNDARLPAFNDLTLRVDHTFKLKKVKINGYLEVINLYNRSNPEAVTYNYNYKEKAYVAGLPIIPNLGFKAEF